MCAYLLLYTQKVVLLNRSLRVQNIIFFVCFTLLQVLPPNLTDHNTCILFADQVSEKSKCFCTRAVLRSFRLTVFNYPELQVRIQDIK